MITNFSWNEMIGTSHKEIDNNPKDIRIIANLIKLAEFLQVIRDELQMPIIVSSGYRCSELNKKIGGAEYSWHMQGLAADIHTIDRKDNDKLLAILEKHKKDLDELGLYIDAKGNYRYFHIGIGPLKRYKRYEKKV